MFKLYYVPGACSLCPHIILYESGLSFEIEKINPRDKKTSSGEDYNTINPKSYVPALLLADGQVLTEVTAIVQYLADQAPNKKLAPANGTMERYRLQEWLNYIATEIHKGFGPLFNKNQPEDVKAAGKERLAMRIGFAAQSLDGKDYLLGNIFTVADAYLFTALRWAQYVGLDLSSWPALKDYMDRITARPSVQTAMQAEGLAGK